MYITLLILSVTALLFALGKVRSDIVALCALLALMLTHQITTEEALSGFSNPVVIMMTGLFVVGGAVLQTGLAKMIGGRIMQLSGDNETLLFLMVILVTAAIGAFVSNTGTVALMLPIVVSMTASKGGARRMLMPLAFASSMGGMLTLIGTPPNIVVQEALIERGFRGLSFFSFFPVGTVAIAVGTIVLLPLSRYFLSDKHQGKNKVPRKKTLASMIKEYGLAENVHEFCIPTQSALVGKSIGEMDIYSRYGLSIIEIRSEQVRSHGIIRSVKQRLAVADSILAADDILLVVGTDNDAKRFQVDYMLKDIPLDLPHTDNTVLNFYDLGIAELLLMPHSPLVGRQVKDCGFREKYNCNVIGLRRGDDIIQKSIGEQTLMQGDVLLVQSTWNNIARLDEFERHWVVLGQPLEEAAKVTLNYKAPVAAAILLLMVLAMVFDFIPIAPVTAVLVASVLMILTSCFRSVESAYKTINWESVIMIAAMMPMSVALMKSGASTLISQSLTSSLGQYGPYALLASIYFVTSLLTMFISNTATAVLMAPIALSASADMAISPYAMLLAVAVAASMCFASPFSTPPNALVMQAGHYSFMDYVKVGLPLQVILGIVMVVVLPMIFPF